MTIILWRHQQRLSIMEESDTQNEGGIYATLWDLKKTAT